MGEWTFFWITRSGLTDSMPIEDMEAEMDNIRDDPKMWALLLDSDTIKLIRDNHDGDVGVYVRKEG